MEANTSQQQTAHGSELTYSSAGREGLLVWTRGRNNTILNVPLAGGLRACAGGGGGRYCGWLFGDRDVRFCKSGGFDDLVR